MIALTFINTQRISQLDTRLIEVNSLAVNITNDSFLFINMPLICESLIRNSIRHDINL